MKNKENALSAGRCQTPALKLIYDKEYDKEINDKNKENEENEEKKVYNTTGYFTNNNIAFELNKQYESEEQIIDFLDGSADYSHIYNCTSPVKTIKKQPEPFTTSRLQQVASNELHYSPKETMRICQTLYEAGYITYMRTDSKIYSEEFIESCKNYILRNYETKYINRDIDYLSNKRIIPNEVNEIKKETKSKEIKSKKLNEKSNEKSNEKNNLAQEAHEAIRPTKITLKELPENMDNKEKKMYKLIWENTLESCMSPAEFYTITANISGYNNTKYTYTSEKIDFLGWKIVSNKLQSDDKEFIYLQSLKQNNIIPYKKIISRLTIKNIKSHYTEARLIQLLEDKGIGRPSTFSSIVDKIQERGYVKKQDIKGKEIKCNDYELENDEISEVETTRTFGNEKNKLVIQPLGVIVIEFLEKYFQDIFNYDYTKEMEDSLDKISKGVMNWNKLCIDCDLEISNLINKLEQENKKKLEIKIDENNIYLIGKHGPIIKSTNIDEDGKEIVSFKQIKENINIDLDKLENGEYKIEDIVCDKNENQNKKEMKENKIIIGRHPQDGCEIILQKGKFGLYISWGNNSKTLKSLGNRPIESIRFEEIEPFLQSNNGMLREISNNISIRKSNRGDYIFFKTTKMKKPQFFKLNEFNEDYINCDISIIKDWIKNKYNIY
jgi:DNA topoisomerase-1